MSESWRLAEQEAEIPNGDATYVPRPRNRVIQDMIDVENANGGLNPDLKLPELRRLLDERIWPGLRAFSEKILPWARACFGS